MNLERLKNFCTQFNPLNELHINLSKKIASIRFFQLLNKHIFKGTLKIHVLYCPKTASQRFGFKRPGTNFLLGESANEGFWIRKKIKYTCNCHFMSPKYLPKYVKIRGKSGGLFFENGYMPFTAETCFLGRDLPTRPLMDLSYVHMM